MNNVENDTKIVKLTWDKKIITYYLFCTSIFMAKVCNIYLRMYKKIL